MQNLKISKFQKKKKKKKEIFSVNVTKSAGSIGM